MIPNFTLVHPPLIPHKATQIPPPLHQCTQLTLHNTLYFGQGVAGYMDPPTIAHHLDHGIHHLFSDAATSCIIVYALIYKGHTTPATTGIEIGTGAAANHPSSQQQQQQQQQQQHALAHRSSLSTVSSWNTNTNSNSNPISSLSSGPVSSSSIPAPISITTLKGLYFAHLDTEYRIRSFFALLQSPSTTIPDDIILIHAAGGMLYHRLPQRNVEFTLFKNSLEIMARSRMLYTSNHTLYLVGQEPHLSPSRFQFSLKDFTTSTHFCISINPEQEYQIENFGMQNVAFFLSKELILLEKQIDQHQHQHQHHHHHLTHVTRRTPQVKKFNHHTDLPSLSPSSSQEQHRNVELLDHPSSSSSSPLPAVSNLTQSPCSIHSQRPCLLLKFPALLIQDNLPYIVRYGLVTETLSHDQIRNFSTTPEFEPPEFFHYHQIKCKYARLLRTKSSIMNLILNIIPPQPMEQEQEQKQHQKQQQEQQEQHRQEQHHEQKQHHEQEQEQKDGASSSGADTRY